MQKKLIALFVAGFEKSGYYIASEVHQLIWNLRNRR